MVTPDSHFSFELARDRLQKLQQALEQSTELTPEQSQLILQQRAAAYSRSPDRDLLASEQIEILTFRLAGEQYAIESRFVSEVLSAPDISDVPGTPPFLTGVTNLRGEILAVMDIGHLLETPHQEETVPWVLVLGQDNPELAIVAAEVMEVISFRTDQLLPAPRAAQDISRDWIRGVTANAETVLDGGSILKDPRLHIDMVER